MAGSVGTFGPAGNIVSGPDTSALTGATGDARQRAALFYQQLAALQQQYQQQLQQQNALGQRLDQQINGTTPSVAGTQLQRGVGEINNAARASAAGAGGNNAALANYGSIQAAGAAQAKANQDAAQLRAQEVAQAEAAKAQLLSQQQAATAAQSGQITGAGTQLSGQGLTGANDIGGLNQAEVGSERALVSNIAGGIGGAMVAKSDEDEKEDISKVKGGDMEAFLKHIGGFNFEYKPDAVDSTAPAGKRVGVMAQDVKRGGPIGRMVSDGHQLDMRNALGAALAAIAHVNKKVDARA